MENYQLIITIINSGFAGEVMNVAREAGAKGGTVVHARGTGSKSMEKKYGIVISPDKEMILILAHSDNVDAILTAINTEAGVGSKMKGISFALPVEHVNGMKY